MGLVTSEEAEIQGSPTQAMSRVSSRRSNAANAPFPRAVWDSPAMTTALRVLVHGPADAAWNMAVDEALLDRPDSGWTLRFYRWRRPTISIGYAQRLAAAADQERAWRLGVDVVRRPTGGRAVLHADELTYALAAPADSTPLSGGIAASYRRIAAGLQAGLRLLGADVEVARSGAAPSPGGKRPCFAARTRYEISVGGRKLVGSAQRRRNGRLLQHGSLLLGAPQPLLWSALGDGFEEAMRCASWLDELLPGRPSTRMLVACLGRGIAGELGLQVRRARLSVAERRLAGGLAHRYRDGAWTARR